MSQEWRDKWLKRAQGLRGTDFLCSSVHSGLCAHHIHILNARAEASNWTDAEIEILGVTVRMTHTWSLDHAERALCWGRGAEMDSGPWGSCSVCKIVKRDRAIQKIVSSERACLSLGWESRKMTHGCISGSLGAISGSQLCHLPSVWCWQSYLMSLSLDFHLCKMGQHCFSWIPMFVLRLLWESIKGLPKL